MNKESKEMARRNSSVSDRLEYFIVQCVASVVAVMPWTVLDWCGGALGWLFYVVDGPHRRLTQENLQVAFPLKSKQECRTCARATFVHFGQVVLNLLKFWKFSPEQMSARVEFVGSEHVEQAQTEGRGILFCTGHFGCWELQALVHALRFQPMAVLARPLDNTFLNEYLETIRTSTGNSVIYRRGSLRRVLRKLAEGGGVGMLIDQHIQGRDAIYVDFFNRPAATTSALAALAARTGAKVIPLFALPLQGGRYQMIYEHAVEPPEDSSDKEMQAFTQRCTNVLETYVRQHPHLWLWMHRRWRDVEPNSDQTISASPTTSSNGKSVTSGQNNFVTDELPDL